MNKRTNWWVFADTTQEISRQVFDIGQSYLQRCRDPKTKPKHLNAYPVQLVKYLYFLYLTASNLMEPVSEPSPRIEIMGSEGKFYVVIHKVNHKHKGSLEQDLPIFDTTEQMMWNFITDGGITLDATNIFQFDRWRSKSKHNLNCLIKTNFRTTLKDEKGHKHSDAGITPSILRYMRILSVIRDHQIRDLAIVAAWLGWKDPRMLYYHPTIRSALIIKSQPMVLKHSGILTSLNIDMAKSIPTY